MNIVKGVAELIRRTHSSQAGDSTTSSPSERLPPPSPRICFSDGGEEAVLSILWNRYENAGEKADKKRLFHVFLKQFLTVFRNWEPAYGGQLLEAGSTTSPSSDYMSCTGNMVVGCLAGHPAEIILALTEEIRQLTGLFSEFDGSTGRSTKDMSAGSIILIITSEGLPVLDALTIVTRSMHNCRVFGYYSGVQKITALMKGAVIQLKTFTSTLFNDGAFSNLVPEKTQLLHQILSYVVSIVCSFMDLNLDVYKKAQLYNNSKEFSLAGTVHLNQFSESSKDPLFETRLQWHRKAVISVMEAGGLNWLVDFVWHTFCFSLSISMAVMHAVSLASTISTTIILLVISKLLRVIRRLSLKEKWMDMSLQYLTLGSLLLALCDNPRGQNHFKSIGGLEVLLDGLGLPSSNLLLSENAAHIVAGRDDYPLEKYFVLHLLSLEVLREAVFGNLINLQFLCENGRVDKFANSFCSPAFLLQEYKKKLVVSSSPSDSQMSSSSPKDDKNVNICKAEASALSSQSDSSTQFWSDYVTELSRVLCSFLPGPEDMVSHHSEVAVARISMPAYVELSIRWVMRVLLTVFPCIKACSGKHELPSNLRMFASVLQHSALDAWSKLLISSPVLIEVLRKEGIWDLIFSANFFYFGPSVELSQDIQMWTDNSFEVPDTCSLVRNEVSSSGVDILQMEVISFVELAAVSSGSNHNLPESSALLDALELSACSPEIAHALVKSLLRILQLSTEKTVASFKALNAVSRVLKVGCIQAQEAKHSEISDMTSVANYHKSDLPEIVQSWPKCMQACMELFVEFWSLVDGARNLVLHDSTCIDCLFDLFWEESLRNNVLSYIVDLMKMVPSSEEDRRAKLLVCSKYLELFTRMKELDQRFEVLSVDLLVSMRDMLQSDPVHYQALFRDGECFLHVLSLLNCNLDEAKGEKLALNVLKTLTYLLSGNDASKAAFRGLVGKGYQTLQSLLLNFCQWHPSAALLNALLDMLVDGHFEINKGPLIKNEDVIILYLCVLQKSSESLRHHGLNVFQQLLRDSLSNRSSCVRAGMLDFLLDWFAQEEDNSVVLKIVMLIQVIGGHSVSGKDIRKIFAILRSEKVGAQRQYRSLLLTSVQSMLNEKGPTAFFDLNGNDSGIIISVPLQWPVNKGFSFSCWLRVESFPHNGTVGLFKFLTENGRGCISVLSNDMLIYESINLKRQRVQMHVNLVRKKWHFLCITHSIGRAFSGGSLLRYYVDGDLVSSERCRYPRVSELMTSCSIATKIVFPRNDEDDASDSAPDSFPFHGQIGPVYLFSDAISSEQIQAVHSLGPSYMYSFLEKEAASLYDNPLSGEVLDAKDGLASKIIFGLNAQASDGRKLFNVSPSNDSTSEKSSFEAAIMGGSELCSRRLLQQIIYCVGGVSVFFPLITQSDRFENNEDGDLGSTQLMPIVKECLTAEVIELIASVLDDNLANQQQMHLLSGFLILGFLLQSVPPKQLNLETLSALKHLFNVVANCGLAELLVKDAISGIFLNPLIWLYSEYQVQRELYMFIIQQFDSDPRLLKSLCRLPRVIDMIWQFYWDNVKSPFAIGGKPLLHPVTGEVIGERPNREEVRKIRLLLLSLGEMSLRQDITAQDIKALVTFFETSQDMTCIEDLLQMVIRAISQKSMLASFLEQVNVIGGCHIFVNLLQREYEPIRLLGLQFIGRLVVGFPAEKKGPKFFNIAVGRSKLQPENTKKNCSRMPPIFAAISDRLFNFQLTDNFCATMFDVLLGGASPKQVLQRQMQIEKQKSKGIDSHFVVPQILVLIFQYLYSIDNAAARIKIMSDLLELLDSNPLNIEALMEYGWNAWLSASLKLDVVKNYMPESIIHDDDEANEQRFVRSIFCVVLSHYVLSVKGGWQYLEETSNFLLLHSQQGSIACWHLLRDIYADLIQRLVDFSSEENIFVSQPCRDNTLYFLRLVDEMLISEIDSKLLFPVNCSECPSEVLELDSLKDYASAVTEIVGGEFDDKVSRNPWAPMQPVTDELNVIDDKWWNLFDNLWLIISEMHGKGPSKMLRKSSSSVGPSIGQRARGLVESLNIPAAEMAAVVVSGGIGNALGGKSNKNIDRAMVLRVDRCPRIVFRLVVLYLCRSSLERASRCVQQVISVLPSILTPDDEQSKSRLQLFIWFLLTIRSTYGGLDDGARIHVIAHLIRETVNCGKSVLATSMVGRDESDTASNSKDTGSMYNLIQKDRVLTAVSEEAKYLKSLKSDRERQLQEFRDRMDEKFSLEFNNKKAFEEEAQNLLHAIHASDESRRTSFLLSQEEEHQNVTEKWMHVFRALIDERGPWSANPFPSRLSIHWKLDKTEDTWRRRPKLRRNYHFDKKLCLPPSSTPSDEAAQYESEAGLVGQFPEQMKRFLLKGVRRITDEGSSDPPEIDAEQSGQKSASDEPSESSCMPAVKSSNDLKDLRHDRKEFSQSSQEAETSEVLISVPCVLVSSKRKLAGRLAVMKDVLHFFGHFLVEGTGGSSVFKDLSVSSNFESAKADQKQKFLKWPFNLDMSNEKGISQDDTDAESLGKTQLRNFKRYRRWHMAKVKAVHWTRYLLRYTSIEVFFCDSVAPIFLNFPTQKDAKEVGKLIVVTRNELLFPKGSSRDKSGVIQFVDRYIALEMAETARERWRRREITNFEYLMILNTLAGRSYNDLTQYPVFPWVLADYSSEVLDFNKSSTFRDLSKPVGALDSKRFEVFEERYCNFCDPDIPSFYYGSHYSSMGIVLYYLLRLEPFTSLHRNLQGGKFDHADRLFQSIEATYRNCLSNTSDVKELIPEFFYLPEFLVNSNSYYFGVKQDGEPIADVSLPTWAKGSPELFVTINREALESEYVSSNLHQWIDLVFGYKQRGKPAVEAANIFYYLTYEGAVDLDTMDDDLQRSAIEDQIANFGQTPIQIFRKKHPRRGPPIPIAHPLYFAPDSINLTSIVPCASHIPSPVLYIHVLESSIVLVNEGLTLSVKLWVTTQLQSGGNFTFSGSQDPFFGVGSDILSPRKIGSALVGNVVLGSQCFATLHTASENFLISCGNWENSFQVISLNDGRMVQSIRQHKDVVSCVAADGSFVATGSYDTTVMVWECIRVKPYDKRVRNAQSEAPRKDYVIVETPFHILCGHDDIVTCLYISVELDVVISGSKDGTCIFHSLRDGRYVKSLRHPSGYALSKLIASHHGHIVLYADDDLSLHLYSINGKHLASSESNGRLHCVELSKCGEFLVSAGDQGQIVVRSMNTLEVVKKYNGVGKIITSLTVTLEECFIAGTKDGVLLVYSIENPQSRRNIPRNVKYKASVAN